LRLRPDSSSPAARAAFPQPFHGCPSRQLPRASVTLKDGLHEGICPYA
jgi:hypothetical protein